MIRQGIKMNGTEELCHVGHCDVIGDQSDVIVEHCDGKVEIVV